MGNKVYTIKDLMDRTKEIDDIYSIVKDLPKDTYTCVSIDGNWGCGKTYVMSLLRQKLENDASNIIVTYDAWENNFYRDPLISILYCILDRLKLESNKDNALNKLIKSILKEAQQDWDRTKVNIIQTIKKGGNSANFKIAFACCIINKLINIGKNLKVNLLDNKEFSDFKSYQSLLKDTKEFLNCLTLQGEKIIIMVDEVDRCLPNEQLIILERLHHLFQINNCVVIVALNKKVVIDAYRTQYCSDDSLLAKDYLKKFFTYNVYLSDKEYVLFNKYLREIMEQYLIHDKDFIDYYVSEIYYLIKRLNVIGYRQGFKLDARNIALFREKLEIILNKCINNNQIGYIEIWYIIVMLYCKMFNPGYIDVNEFKYGNSNREIFINVKKDLFNDLVILEIQPYSYSEGTENYYIYDDKGYYNEYQYLINYSLFRHNKIKINDLKRMSKFNKNYNWIDDVMNIIDKLGNRIAK